MQYKSSNILLGGCASKNKKRAYIIWEQCTGAWCSNKDKNQIPTHTKPYLVEYIALQMEAMDDEWLQNDLDDYWGGDCTTSWRACGIMSCII